MADAKPEVTWDHVHIRTKDPAATAKWFGEMLGAEIVDPSGGVHVKFGNQRIMLAKVTDGDGVNPPPVTPYRGLDHVAFYVKHLDVLAAQLKAKGVTFTKDAVTVRPGVHVCFIQTPEGVSVELLERDPKYK